MTNVADDYEDDPVMDQFYDDVTAFKNEQRSVMIIGNAIHGSFKADQDFRLVQALILIHLNKCESKLPFEERLSISDALNSNMVCAYHYACSAERLDNFATEYATESYQFELLRLVDQAFGPSAIFELCLVRGLLRSNYISIVTSTSTTDMIGQGGAYLFGLKAKDLSDLPPFDFSSSKFHALLNDLKSMWALQ